MEHLEQITRFISSDKFFEYHGLTLTILWTVACTAAIIAKRLSVQLHGSLFFLIDVTTLFFITGAWVRVYPHIDSFNEWSTIKKLHIIGGTVFAAFLIFQHILGVYTLYITRKRAKLHVRLAWFLTNAARVIAYFGWCMGHYDNKEKMAEYTLIAAVVLFILSTVNSFFLRSKAVETPSAKKTK